MHNVRKLKINRFDEIDYKTLNSREQDTVLSLAMDVLATRFQPGKELKDPDSVSTYLQIKYAMLDYEVFGVYFLDTRHRVICYEESFGAPLMELQSIHVK